MSTAFILKILDIRDLSVLTSFTGELEVCVDRPQNPHLGVNFNILLLNDSIT